MKTIYQTYEKKTPKSLNLNYKDFWFSHFRKWQVKFLPANNNIDLGDFFLPFNQPFFKSLAKGRVQRKISGIFH